MSESSRPSYEEYLELKYSLTSDLKTLTENVNRLSESVEKRFDSQDKEMEKQQDSIEKLSNRLQGAKEGTKAEGSSSLPSNIKWLLILIFGIAFLGCLGAAIGINLLEYFKSVV